MVKLAVDDKMLDVHMISKKKILEIVPLSEAKLKLDSGSAGSLIQCRVK